MYYSYVEIEYVATSFSLARTDLALKLLTTQISELKKEVSQVKASATSIIPAPAPTVPGSSKFE
jgi:hypothetical protein